MTTHIPSLTLPEQFFTKPALAVLFPVVLGFGSGYLFNSTDVQRDYASWKKPRLYPPGWVFPPVWVVLYASMGAASYFAWNTGMSSINPNTVAMAKHGATLYTIQLGVLQFFMPLFFNQKRPVAALANIVSVAGMVAYMMSIWGPVDQRATYLLAPYLAWLSFATYICVSIGSLNNWDLTVTPAEKSR